MINFQDYDNGVAKFNEALKINSNPVFSWDFYSDAFMQLKSRNVDTKKIKELALASKWVNVHWDIKNALSEEVIVVTDASLTIVFASQNIAKMNGYKSEEVVGKSPRMFQGAATCQETSNEIKKAIKNGVPFEKKVVNYKKNGDLYYCLIKGFPVFNKKGNLSHFIAFEQAA
ncbi:PAS domain S-box-containing protein [Flavobacterium sp. 7E]|uniref:PAS domain-containing protein n=1 Tax=Flavobacterium sp. 7E TaxID=2735898 RepID=UPI00156FE7ED|nr:PAS domain-containing protein [Flavobacterium sp. 7E]NRS88660.1 PAS domain S-box-containing protein [Flavobacterium sp. 7E]